MAKMLINTYKISILNHIKNKPKGCANTVPALTKQPKMEAVMANLKVRISTTQEQEIWKPVKGFEYFYEISNYGRVRSYRVNNLPLKRAKKPKILKGSVGPHYRGVAFGRGNYFTVHTLVAKHFIPNPDNKPEVNHKDGNKLNNFYKNLEWATHQENMLHASQTGLTPNKGEQNSFAELSKQQVIQIRDIFDNSDIMIKTLAERFNVHRRTISRIVKRETWRHI
ncbi:MAG: hypothetical protein CL666_08725 [Balneola sp.]|nr:hypothetical protein [Balneola sp.]|tara:strand:+ start:10577 stop:11248 length:672 start_codon:yes stop_codon:yes gene_type:complete